MWNSLNTKVLFEDNIHDISNYLLSRPNDIDIKVNNITPLINAIKYLRVNVVDLLIRSSCNVNLSDDTIHRNTPLHYACFYSKYQEGKDIIKILIRAGSKVTIKNTDGDLPLHYAIIQSSDIHIINLLTKNLYQNDINNVGNSTLLTACKYNKNPDIIMALLNITPLINCINKYNETALHYACYHNNLKVVKILLDFGADPNIPNDTNEDCFDICLYKTECLNILKSTNTTKEFHQ